MPSRSETQQAIKNIAFDAVIGIYKAIHEHAYPPEPVERIGSGKVWYSRNAAAKLLDVSTDTIDRWRKLPEDDPKHLPEYEAPGDRKPRFHIDDLNRFLPTPPQDSSNG